MSDRDAGLLRCLSALTEDLLFATISSDTVDVDLWRELAKRRWDTYSALIQGQVVPGPAQMDAWLPGLVRAMVPVAAPSWLPMRELVDGGVTLLGGARGLRSLFSQKPGEKEVQRVRRLGALAVRLSVSIMHGDGALSADEQRMHHALIAALGVGAEDEQMLLAMGPIEPSAIETSADVDPKVARQLTAGAWQSALQDGLDARDEGAVAAAANRLGVPMVEVGTIGVEAKKASDQRHAVAAAGIEAIVFLLADDPACAKRMCAVLAELGAPGPYRADLNKASEPSGPVALTTRNIDKATKISALTLAWLAALNENPHYIRRAALAVRHDRIGNNWGVEPEATKVRHSTEAFLDAELSVLAKLADEKR